MLRHLVVFALALSLPLTADAQEAPPQRVASVDIAPKTNTTPQKGAFKGSKLMYTTYFYTATEAIVHGYEKDTNVRIVSLEQNRTIWTGKVGPGETQLVHTGKGVFGFLSDKKASLLVGTPSSCTVVGYWLRDQEGTHVANHFYGRIPASGSPDDRVLVWAWEDMKVQITDVTTDKLIKEKKIKKGGYLELTGPELTALGTHVLEFSADKKKMAVQVYFDEGFFVPGPDGRTAGREFRTYVGKTTEGVNDLNLIAYFQKAKVRVKDLKSGKSLFNGVIEPGKVHTLTLAGQYVQIDSDVEISALVAPYQHYQSGYAEHHYGAGVEGTGIETEFLITSPRELWVFSYFANNTVTVTDERTGREIWKGELGAGHVQGLQPGYGYFRVKSSAGISVMGGDQACGAEYSPAAGLFTVDEELLKVATQILEDRREEARKKGKKLSAAEEAAPLNDAENRRARKYIRDNLGKSMSAPEVQERLDSMQTYE